MTNNYHQPLDTGAAASSFNLNVPLQQLDEAIGDYVTDKNAFIVVPLTILTVDTTTITMSGITDIYSRLIFNASFRCDDAGVGNFLIEITFNGDTGGNYSYAGMLYLKLAGVFNTQFLSADPSNLIPLSTGTTGNGQAADIRSFVTVEIVNYRDTNNFKLVHYRIACPYNSNEVQILTGGALWKNTAAITSITIEVNGARP